MAKVTSKYQVTVPRAIADQYQIKPGDEIDWVAADEVIRVIPPGKRPATDDTEMRLRLFDQATARISKRGKKSDRKRARERGWKREDLYARGRSN